MEGGFTSKHGQDAIKKLLEDDLEFDCVVAVNDYSAFGVMTELAKNNILVPAEVAVTGFDDVDEASMVIPSLATVRQPLKDLGRAVIDSIWAMLNGGLVNNCVILPTMPIHRRSCGCFSDNVEAPREPQQQMTGMSKQELVEHLV